MIDRAFADKFAAEWIAHWNSRDLDAILSHYVEDVVFHSPRIALVMGQPIDFVSGKTALRRYWAKALEGNKDLRFDLDLAYRNQRGQHVTETFVFDGNGHVRSSIATYA